MVNKDASEEGLNIEYRQQEQGDCRIRQDRGPDGGARLCASLGQGFPPTSTVSHELFSCWQMTVSELTS